MKTARRLRRGARRDALGVDLAASLEIVGAILKWLSLAFLFPTAVALGYSESVWPFVGSLAGGFLFGWTLERLMRGQSARGVGAREGFLIVSLTWLLAAGLGSLPYLFGEEQLSRPLDAYFEAMSGFTTTGASALTDLTALDRSMLMWRQFSQWLGGMGIIVLALAVLPRLRVGGRQLLEQEMPGPELEGLPSRVRDVARRMWLLYVGLTLFMIAILTTFGWLGVDEHMSLYQATAHAFATLPTGGFGVDPRSAEPFAAATQWVIALFMVVAGANFALIYRGLVRRELRAVRRDQELRLYLVILVAASVVVATQLIDQGVASGEAAARHAFFQVASLMTTTGFATVDFGAWATTLPLAAIVLVGVMFVGGCAGSTAGSIKVVRHLILGKMLRRELDQTVHPSLVRPVRINRAALDERTVRAVAAFILLYVGLFVVGTAILVADATRVGADLSIMDAIAAAATTLGNVGPGLGFAGPMGSFAPFSDVSTVTMIGLMWLGRLELLPIIVLATKNYWRA